MKHENIADIYKLTPIQQGILFHSLYTPQSGVYFEQFSWTVNQEWIVPVFERAWQYVVDQHPILRTAFFWEDLDEPIQVVQRQARLPFSELDWSDLSPAEQEARLETYLQTDREQGFDLTEAPLMRVTVIRGGPETFHFVWSYHHLLLDGWSVPLVLQDVFTAYSAFTQDQTPRLNRRRPYRDYLAWLRKKDLAEAERYWRPILQGFSEPTPLPVDHNASRAASIDGYEKTQIEISPAQTEALQALARRERLTLSTLVHGAWALLLQGYSGGNDLVFGTTVSGRPADLAGSETMVGCFINTLPIRVEMRPDQALRDWLAALQQRQVELRQYAYSPLVEVQRWSNIPPGERLFESIVVFENYPTDALSESDLRIFQKTNYPLTLVAVPRLALTLRIGYETQHFAAATIERLLAQLQTLLESMADRLDQPLSEITLLSEAERRRLLVEWNATAQPYAHDACLHTLIERQAEQTPEAVAVAFEDQKLTYAELNARANQLAHRLRSLGVRPESRVAICMKRSQDLLVGLLAVLKAGGAYVPLDPAYPAARLAFMLQDAAPAVLLTESRVAAQLPSTDAEVILLDRAGPALANQPATNPNTAIAPGQIAYMIYTSGSTGQPKGVMVPHGAVVNFLTAMQSQIGCGAEDALLATTSISFDISVLELFWPLTQGAKVVILAEHAASGMPAHAEQARSDRAIDFSLFYFASDDSGASGDKYRLLIEGAKFADQHDFAAVWTPERHFHEFGGLYPNPAITSAALATITERVQLRAGSVVMPLHDPIRVAEEWAVVDNISKGRVGIAFASGWHANDFVFFPERYAQRKQATADGITAVQKLWRGESLTVQSGAGNPIDVRIFPKPVQAELPIWITAAGNPETFIEAGKTGANILTHLLGQSLEDVAEKVRLYRAARAESGFDPDTGKVTLMLHTFIGEDRDAVRETVREPFTNYLRSSVGLIANLARSANIAGDINSLNQADMDALLAFAFDRYFETSAMFGTVETCAEMVERLKAIGIDEIGCLVDFGVEADQALAALERLNTLRELTSQPVVTTGASLPVQARKHRATLLQGTPSLAKLLLLQPDTLPSLRSLRALLLGGEALPTALAQQLLPILSGRLINMYGPTETTIWSATHPVTDASETNLPIGRPIANTEIYLLDSRLQPTPIGVPGELYIGGVGVTRGYYQHPALTAERYLPDPFGPRPGGRIYKTGDLARYLPDGTIEFLGRIDYQVKLRGFRIELGEIEAVLSQHPAIREAVVVARQDTADTRLVAYVVENQELRTKDQGGESEGSQLAGCPCPEGTRRAPVLGSAELRQYVGARLPEYMVPSAFVTLDALPLTPNGKVDRRALPAPDAALGYMEPTVAQPRTPTEEVVASLWERVLGVEHVGVHDNFFMLGGHSLLATQILSRVRETFQVELALSTLFNTPTVAGMAEQVELAQQMASGLQAPPIEHVSRDRLLPLSFAQQRIWFLQQVEPGSATYNNPTAVRLKGALDLPALTHSLNTIVQRHEVLRTTFPMIEGRPVQQIMPRLTLELPLIDLSERPDTEQQTEMRRIGTQEAQRPFDLVNGPLIRALIFKHTGHEHTLLVTMHHIVSDGWSLGVLIREIAVLYTALSNHAQLEARSLPELPIQYADYAAWQRSWLQGEVLAAQQAYWKQQLSGHIPALNLPTDHPRPPVRTYHGAKQSLHFPKPLLDGLTQLSRSAGTTLFMTLMSGLNALLYRYSGQTDLVIGSPIANRHHGQVEELIGCFINTLVLRSDLSGNPTFTDLLGRSREVALGAYAHQDLPFEQVVEIAEYEHDISRHPLFQVFFILQNTPMSAVNVGDLTLTTVDITTETAKFDLAFELIETEIGIIGAVEYNTDIFEAATIERMIGHFERLLEHCVVNPEQRLSDLAFLSDTERHTLLVDWNATGVEYAQDVCLHTLIEQQAALTPDATALVFADTHLSYAALNARANQLAHHLRSLGTSAETRVAVCMERSLDLVIALVAVLKSGGVYVPIDPDYPKSRVGFMLADAAAPVLLTQQHLLDSLPRHQAQVLCVDTAWPAIAQQPTANPALVTTASNLAYVIYTSGSTGQPKGAMNTHQAICNRLRWMQDAFGLDASDRVLQKTPFSFDVSVWEFFWPLLAGATLVVATPGGHQDSAYLANLIARERITTLHFVPSMLQVFLDEPDLARCHALRRVICSGEALPLALQERCFTRLSAQLHNLYGPTEAAVDVTWWPCQPNAGLHTVPIGRPIANTQIYLLDPHLRPVPVGVPGELHIGGIQLARGYLHRPELTAEKFVPDPFSAAPNARLYKTGDLARYLPDGAIEYLGRLDFQVKVRGFRIELGEIETALGQHPQLREVVVLARQDTPPTGEHPDTRLVAYLVENKEQAGEGLGAESLRRFLQDKLPEYMIPAAFVVLDALPLSPNGKVDRKALPEPDTSRPELEAAFVPPQTPQEQTLAEIWQSVLGLERVGVHDNFFALGGDSMRSIRVLSQARDHGLSLTLQQLFQHQTIGELARTLGDSPSSTSVQQRVEPFSLVAKDDRLQLPGDVEDAYPLGTLQVGMLFHSEYNPDSAVYHDIFTQHIRMPFNTEAMRSALRELVARHEILRTSFDLTNYSQPLQLVHRAAEPVFEVEDLRYFSAPEQQAAIVAWMEEDKRQPFDWQRAPLLRIQIHRRTDDDIQFTVSFHHAILDGWSLAAMNTELFTLYFAHLGKAAPALAAPPTSGFRDFIALEQQALNSPETRDYWTRALADSVTELIPRWPAEGNMQAERQIRAQPVPVAETLSDQIKQLAQQTGVSLKSVLLAAHLRVLSLLHGRSDVLSGLVSHGRPETEDGERILGMFLNTLPFRLDLRGGSWLDLIRATFAAEREMLPHRWYPMAEIQRNLGGQQMFETAFNYVDFYVYQSLGGLSGFRPMGGQFFQETNFTLSANFSLDQMTGAVQLGVEYDASQIPDAQAEAIAEYYARALAAMVNQPHARYDRDTLLSDIERQRLLVDWNATETSYPQSCAHLLFEAQVERTPEAIALAYGELELSYRDLNTRANQLAWHLRSLGVRAESRVAICLERSPEMIVGLLGIWKAGGVYVPLDPAYPQDRLHYMLQDSGAAVLLMHQSVADRLQLEEAQHSARVVRIDTDWTAIDQERSDNPASGISPDNLAYIIYTSGSTGRPKGVLVPHRGLCNLASAQIRAFGVTVESRVLQFASFSFDASVSEICMALLAGATLSLGTQDSLVPGPAALQVLREQAITTVTLPPSVLAVLTPSDFPALQTLIAAGEPCPPNVVERWRVPLNGHSRRFFNAYGPTETTVCATIAECRDGSRKPPIGHAIDNMQVYVLNQDLQPTPIGVLGEIYVGGVGVARGYNQRPDLTAERFVPDPFGGTPGARLYRTGDQARYLPNGDLEYIGRIDHQVKVRGFRIELGEIESALRQHQAVRDAVVIVREETGDKRIVAYIVGEQTNKRTNEQSTEYLPSPAAVGEGPGVKATVDGLVPELRRFLLASLPEYMIPAAFVQLDALPLTPNGKVDRRALPAPDTARSEQSYVAPRTPTEETVARILSEILVIDRVGAHDNFFELGGHSLMAMQLISRLRHAFQVELPLRVLYESATVADLALTIVQRQAEQADTTELDEMLAELDQLSDEEVQALLASGEGLDE